MASLHYYRRNIAHKMGAEKCGFGGFAHYIRMGRLRDIKNGLARAPE
jgi:hypothetical protein